MVCKVQLETLGFGIFPILRGHSGTIEPLPFRGFGKGGECGGMVRAPGGKSGNIVLKL